jgi:hypothetical protein
MAVLSLKKLKFKPELLGLVNTNAFNFPIGHADLKKDHRDKEGRVFLHSYQMLTASSVVSPIIVMLKKSFT